MQIAYVINSMEGGGAASPVPAITGVMRNYGVNVAVFALTRRNGHAIAAIEAAGLDLFVRPGGEHDHLAALRWLDKAISDWGATHIWTSLTRATLLGQLVGRKRGLPVVSWQHNAFLKPVNLRLLRAMRGFSKLWVADSRSVADLTAQRLGISADRLFTWPIFSANPDAPVAREWRMGETIRVGSLGRLHPAKGYDVLIAALVKLGSQGFSPPAPFELLIAGEGADRSRLEAALAQANFSNIRLVGHISDPKPFLASLHLYVQPSRREGFCIAAHEAMQAGVPVLASSVGELVHSVVPGVTGELVPPENIGSLAQALKNLLENPARLARMGRQARAAILDSYSAERFAAAGFTILSQLAAGTSGQRR